MPNAEFPRLLYTFLKGVSLTDVPRVIPPFTTQSNVKDSVHPILGSKAVTA